MSVICLYSVEVTELDDFVEKVRRAPRRYGADKDAVPSADFGKHFGKIRRSFLTRYADREFSSDTVFRDKSVGYPSPLPQQDVLFIDLMVEQGHFVWTEVPLPEERAGDRESNSSSGTLHSDGDESQLDSGSREIKKFVQDLVLTVQTGYDEQLEDMEKKYGTLDSRLGVLQQRLDTADQKQVDLSKRLDDGLSIAARERRHNARDLDIKFAHLSTEVDGIKLMLIDLQNSIKSLSVVSNTAGLTNTSTQVTFEGDKVRHAATEVPVSSSSAVCMDLHSTPRTTPVLSWADTSVKTVDSNVLELPFVRERGRWQRSPGRTYGSRQVDPRGRMPNTTSAMPSNAHSGASSLDVSDILGQTRDVVSRVMDEKFQEHVNKCVDTALSRLTGENANSTTVAGVNLAGRDYEPVRGATAPADLGKSRVNTRRFQPDARGDYMTFAENASTPLRVSNLGMTQSQENSWSASRGPTSKLPVFDGEKFSYWEPFIGHFQSLVDQYGWFGREAQKLGECLRGKAQEFYYAIPIHLRCNYEYVKKKFASVYAQNVSSNMLRMKLCALKQGKEQPLADFVREISMLAFQAFPENSQEADEAAISALLAGMYRQDVAVHLVYPEPVSLDEVVQRYRVFLQREEQAKRVQPLVMQENPVLLRAMSVQHDKGFLERGNSPKRFQDSKSQGKVFGYGSPKNTAKFSPGKNSLRQRDENSASAFQHLSTQIAENNEKILAKQSELLTQFIQSQKDSNKNLASQITQLVSSVTKEGGNSRKDFKSPPRTQNYARSGNSPGRSPRNFSGGIRSPSAGNSAGGVRSPRPYGMVDMQQVICHRCDERGHYARDCTAPMPKHRVSFAENNSSGN